MSKIKLLSLLAAVLFLINLAWIGFWYFKPEHHRGEGPKKLIIEKLHFNEAQIKAYEVLIDQHRKDIRAADRELQSVKSELYHSLTEAEVSGQDSLFRKLGEVHHRIEKIHYDHFRDIRGLCKPEQIPAYESLTKELTSLFFGRPHHPGRP